MTMIPPKILRSLRSTPARSACRTELTAMSRARHASLTGELTGVRVYTDGETVIVTTTDMTP